MDEKEQELFAKVLPPTLRPPDRLEKAADIVAFLSEIGGTIGGVLHPGAGAVAVVVAYLLGGYADGRKFQRLSEFISVVHQRVLVLEEESFNYVRSDEFIDLTEQVMSRVGVERNQEKRFIYGAYLADVIASPGTASYDVHLRYIMKLEQLQGDDIRILKAIITTPIRDRANPAYSTTMGNTVENLSHITGFETNHVDDILTHLSDLRIIDDIPRQQRMRLDEYDYNQYITRLGQGFTRYLLEEAQA